MLTINLFDENFRHDVCSVAWKTPEYITYVRDRMEWDGITVFTDAYIYNPVVNKVKSKYKIGWLHEPQCLWPFNYSLSSLYQVIDKFDFILTYYKPLLERFPDKFKFCPYGGVWIPKEHWGIKPKTKNISMLYGEKMSTRGHKIRHEIAKALPLGSVDFYGYQGEPVDYSWQTKLKVLGDYRFSIVCETCREDNLFTEILLDCFAVGTIPIFWGAPNIGEFFDYWSIEPFVNINQVVEIVTMASRDDNGISWYNEYKTNIQDNLNRVAQYAITEDWLYHNVFKDLI